MARLTGTEVLPFVLRTMDGVEGLPAGESHWTNGEVYELLGIIAEGLRRPEWSEVSVAEVVRERDVLREALADRDVQEELASELWKAAFRVVEEQRDAARSIAVRLEQEVAEVSRGAIRLQEVTAYRYTNPITGDVMVLDPKLVTLVWTGEKAS